MPETIEFDEAAVRTQLESETVPEIKARIDETNEARVKAGAAPLVRSGPKSRLIDALVAAYQEAGIDTTAAIEPVDPEDVVDEDPPEHASTTEPPPEGEPLEDVPGTELVPLRPPETVMPTSQEYAAMEAIANKICRTEFVPSDFRNRPEAVLAAILTGRELGIGPMQSLKDISILDGRPALAASLMMALMRKGGVVVLESESTDERAWIKAKRTDTGEVMAVEWTYEAADKVVSKNGKKLTDKDNWKNYRPDMLWARAVGRLGRRLAPDILGGMGYSAEEMADFDGGWDDNPYAPPPTQAGAVQSDGWIIPSGWKELHGRFATALGGVTDVSAAEATEWLKQAIKAKVEVESIGDLTPEQTKVVWRPLTNVLKRLEHGGDVVFREDVREFVSQQFKDELDVAVVGPPWRLSPTEESLPTYYDHTGTDEPVPIGAEATADEAEWTPVERTFTVQEAKERNVAWAAYVVEHAGEDLPIEPPNDWDVGTEFIPF